MALTLAFSDAETAAITAYAKRNNIDVLDFVRNTVMPIIRREDDETEDERDRRLYDEAMAEYLANPVSYSHAEVGKMLGLT